jgi:hypothetical protein
MVNHGAHPVMTQLLNHDLDVRRFFSHFAAVGFVVKKTRAGS